MVGLIGIFLLVCCTDSFSISSELLLRIDSLVLTGMIGSNEASDLRRLVMNSRGSLSDDLYDIVTMNDAELLAELRHFSQKRKTYVFSKPTTTA